MIRVVAGSIDSRPCKERKDGAPHGVGRASEIEGRATRRIILCRLSYVNESKEAGQCRAAFCGISDSSSAISAPSPLNGFGDTYEAHDNPDSSEKAQQASE
jgi:hypothetical protein